MKKSKKTQKRSAALSADSLKDLDKDTLISVVMKLVEQNRILSERFQAFMDEKYGRKTERFEDPNQLRIGEGLDSKAEPQETIAAPAADSTQEPKRKKRPGHGRNPMPSRLKRVERRPEPTADQLLCACGGRRKKLNEVIRCERYDCVPVSLYVEQIIDIILQCEQCHDSIVVEADVCEPIPNGAVGPQLLVEIAENRWLNHSPLHRQEQIFARKGADIPRSTMCGWMNSLVDIVRPLYFEMKSELLKSTIIALDDTPVKVLDRSKKQNIKRGHEWINMGDEDHPVNVFNYTERRNRDGPKTFLSGFKGFIQGDCFSGNRALCVETGATLVACMAHARRYFKKSQRNEKALSDEALAMFNALFEIEASARALSLSAEDTLKMRQQEALPILAKLKTWLDAQVVTALPQSSFGKAVNYCLNNWTELNNYLLHGRLRIDNNLAEHQMKKVSIGKKNWYFFGSDDGGEHASVVLSLLSTAQRHGLEPGAYLYDVVVRLTANPRCELQQLLPHNWKQQTSVAGIEGVQSPPEMALR